MRISLCHIQFRVGLFIFLIAAFSSFSLRAKSPLYYVISHAGPGDPYWTVVYNGVREAADKLGVKVVFSAPPRPGDLAQQHTLLKAAIAARPNGIATVIPDKVMFADLVQRARSKNIPVIAFDAREVPRDAKKLPYQAYIGTDEYQAGLKVGRKASLKLGKGCSAVVAIHQPGHVGLEQRFLGIRDSLRKQRNCKVKKLDITSNPSKGISLMKGYLKRYPKTNAVFALGPLGTTTVGKSLEEAKLSKKLLFATFDLDETTLKYLKKKLLSFTVDSLPYMQGFMVVMQLYLASNYALPPVDMDTSGGFVTTSNVDLIHKLVKKGVR